MFRGRSASLQIQVFAQVTSTSHATSAQQVACFYEPLIGGFMAQAAKPSESQRTALDAVVQNLMSIIQKRRSVRVYKTCLLYTSDAADERSSVDLGGRR